MKKIVINKDNLTIDNVADKKYKSRIIVINANNELLVTVNGGVYLLPGGSMCENETMIEAVIREVKEELGCNLKQKNIVPLVSYEEYCPRFPKRDGVTFVSRYTKTGYFYYTDTVVVDESKTELSASEKLNFSYMWIKIDLLARFLKENSDDSNLKRPFFDRELLTIMDEYLGTLR